MGFQVELDSIPFGFLAILYQDKPIEILIKLNKDNKPLDITTNDSTGLSPKEFQQLNEVAIRFYSSHQIVPDSLYRSWREVREYEEDVMFPLELKEAFETTLSRAIFLIGLSTV